MPEDVRTDAELEIDEETPVLVHDDIVQRLLDYQRQLREGTDGLAEPEVIVVPEATDAASSQTLDVDDVALEASDAISDDAVARPDDPPSATAEGSTDIDATPALSRLEEALDAAVVADAAAEERGLDDERANAPKGATDDRSETDVADAEVADVIDISSARLEAEATHDLAIVSVVEDDATGAAPSASSTADVEARLARMEYALGTLSGRLSELRTSFGDMAIAADERLAEIENLLTDVRRDR